MPRRRKTAPKQKTAKAYEAMKEIGIPLDTVKPVLKRLLKVYNNNWALIEDGNYGVLVDAIFDNAETEGAETRKKGQLHDEPEEPEEDSEDSEPLLKRMCLRNRKEQASSSLGNSKPGRGGTPSRRPLLDDVEPSKTRGKEKMVESSQLFVGDELNGSKPVSPQRNVGVVEKPSSPQTCLEMGGDEPFQLRLGDTRAASHSFSPETHLRDKRTTPEFDPRENKSKRETRIVCFNESSVECDGFSSIDNMLTESNEALVMPKSEPFADDLPQHEAPLPLAMIFPDGSSNGNCSSAKADSLEFLDSKHQDVEDKGDELSNLFQFDIASSPKEEVKITLILNPSRQSAFRIPRLDEVLKVAEDKILKSYGITEPGFSVMKLMRDLCKCFLAVATDYNGDKQLRCVLKETDAQNIFGGRGDYQGNFYNPPSFLNGSVKFQNFVEIAPQIPKPLAPSGLKNLQCIVGLDENLTENIFSGEKKKMKVLKCFVSCVNDITRGEERVKISLVNEVSTKSPPKFIYIPRNMVYHNAYVNFALARISDEDCCSCCFEDCLSVAIPCACARESGGEFAYTLGGLIKDKFLEDCLSMNRDPQQHRLFFCEDCPLERSNGKTSNPCKGHLVKKFIKECWCKCGCSKKCGNRVVQRGITVNLQVFLTPEGKGWGLRTLEDLPKGAFVCEYVGEIVTNTELYERNMKRTGKHTYPVLLDADWGSEGVLKDEEALCLDATLYGNVARFINHRCSDANLVVIPVEVETPDHHYYHTAFFTTRKVDAMEELTWDYCIDFNDLNHPVKAFQCCCGSKFCRDLKLSKRTKCSS